MAVLYESGQDRIKDELETLRSASNQPVGLAKVEGRGESYCLRPARCTEQAEAWTGGEMFDLVSHLFVATSLGLEFISSSSEAEVRRARIMCSLYSQLWFMGDPLESLLLWTAVRHGVS